MTAEADVAAEVGTDLAAEVGAGWLAAMQRGDWEAAWQQTDRLELPRRAKQQMQGFERQAHHLVWDGSPFAGQRVRVRCLHGLGDTLQFMRFVPLLQAQARSLDFLVQPMLLDLLRGAPGLGEVSNAWTDDPPPCDVEIEIMELAYALRVHAGAVPPPYAHLAGQIRGVRLPGLPPAEGLRVGLLWAASDWDTSRSVPLSALAPVLRVPGVTFYNLQQGEAALHPDVHGLGLVPLSSFTQEIPAAAAAMMQMDLVISVDGMPAHLAATLGKPTWLLLKHDADWRWTQAGEDTPWYPAMRLFRQRSPGDWASAVEALTNALTGVLKSALESASMSFPAFNASRH